MPQSTPTIPFPAGPQPLDAQFNLDALTSDGGLVWLAEADAPTDSLFVGSLVWVPQIIEMLPGQEMQARDIGQEWFDTAGEALLAGFQRIIDGYEHVAMEDS